MALLLTFGVSKGYRSAAITEAGGTVYLEQPFALASDYVVDDPYAEDTDGQKVLIRKVVKYADRVVIYPETDAAFVEFTVTRRAN